MSETTMQIAIAIIAHISQSIAIKNVCIHPNETSVSFDFMTEKGFFDFFVHENKNEIGIYCDFEGESIIAFVTNKYRASCRTSDIFLEEYYHIK